MRCINLVTERNMTVVQMILIAANLIKIELNEENLYKFAVAVEGKFNTSMSPWLLGEHPTKTSLTCKKPKVKGRYINARVYKVDKIVREKIGHKAIINWIY